MMLLQLMSARLNRNLIQVNSQSFQANFVGAKTPRVPHCYMNFEFFQRSHVLISLTIAKLLMIPNGTRAENIQGSPNCLRIYPTMFQKMIMLIQLVRLMQMILKVRLFKLVCWD